MGETEMRQPAGMRLDDSDYETQSRRNYDPAADVDSEAPSRGYDPAADVDGEAPYDGEAPSRGEGAGFQEITEEEVVYPPDEEGDGERNDLASLEAELAEVRNRLVRNTADYDNYRKRLRRNQEEGLRYANEGLLRDLLPIIDDLSRAVTVAPEKTSFEVLHEGVTMVVEALQGLLRRYGVEPIHADEGVLFDPAVHDAMQRVETAEMPSGCVVRELQTGYLYHQRLLRPARVTVAAPDSSGKAFDADYDESDDEAEVDIIESEDTIPEVECLDENG